MGTARARRSYRSWGVTRLGLRWRFETGPLLRPADGAEAVRHRHGPRVRGAAAALTEHGRPASLAHEVGRATGTFFRGG